MVQWQLSRHESRILALILADRVQLVTSQASVVAWAFTSSQMVPNTREPGTMANTTLGPKSSIQMCCFAAGTAGQS